MKSFLERSAAILSLLERKDHLPVALHVYDGPSVFFSFVTMSTLGYGDIAPRTPLTQTLTWMQSVTGQFYIAVLVAWLVSEIPRRQRDKIP